MYLWLLSRLRTFQVIDTSTSGEAYASRILHHKIAMQFLSTRILSVSYETSIWQVLVYLKWTRNTIGHRNDAKSMYLGRSAVSIFSHFCTDWSNDRVNLVSFRSNFAILQTKQARTAIHSLHCGTSLVAGTWILHRTSRICESGKIASRFLPILNSQIWRSTNACKMSSPHALAKVGSPLSRWGQPYDRRLEPSSPYQTLQLHSV